jgi:hypothetical protein
MSPLPFVLCLAFSHTVFCYLFPHPPTDSLTTPPTHSPASHTSCSPFFQGRHLRLHPDHRSGGDGNNKHHTHAHPTAQSLKGHLHRHHTHARTTYPTAQSLKGHLHRPPTAAGSPPCWAASTSTPIAQTVSPLLCRPLHRCIKPQQPSLITISLLLRSSLFLLTTSFSSRLCAVISLPSSPSFL